MCSSMPSSTWRSIAPMPRMRSINSCTSSSGVEAPAETPTEGLAIDKLARLNVSGGNIRNIALNAAFLAAAEGDPVRMAHLATVGSFAVNGVAALHTELLKSTVMHDFHELWPDKFFNVTNGVTPRRFLRLSNPPLSQLISHI